MVQHQQRPQRLGSIHLPALVLLIIGQRYIVALRPAGPTGNSSRLVWRTEENGQVVEYTQEPARSGWQRLKVNLLGLLPLGSQL